jgi:predicted N-acetyltransferase YhbS
MAELTAAVAECMREWIVRNALASGGAVTQAAGGEWADKRAPSRELTLAFPRLGAEASEVIDAMLAVGRDQGAASVACWSLLPPTPPDLGARLVARGFEWGWQPHWMVMELDDELEPAPRPDGVELAEVDGLPDWDVADLPYFDRAAAGVYHALTSARPQRVWHFAAYRDGRPVGHTLLSVTSADALEVAGIFDAGVVPAEERRGIGRALTVTACLKGRELGCSHAALNATPAGEPLYRRIGFRSLGMGQTWWLHGPTLKAPPPTPVQIALGEAIGRGDTAALAALPNATAQELAAPLPGGMTPLDLAVASEQPAAAEWLVSKGVPLDALSAWDLGWRDRAAELLSERPELVHHVPGDPGMTLLHVAAERGDLELARLALDADAEPDRREPNFGATPLDWARHFGRDEIAAMIEGAARG